MTDQLWTEEYKKGGVPSSVRTEPSGAVVYFVEKFFPLLLQKEGRNETGLLYGLDIGCGAGRNSLYLARTKKCCMTALDYVADNIKNIAQHNVPNVAAIRHDLLEHWPVQDQSQDFAIDTFCFKHFVEEGERSFYIKELARVLKNDSLFLLTLAGDDDGYYSQFLCNQQTEQSTKKIIDQQNGIASLLYTRTEVETLLASFTVIDYQHKTTPSAMHGRTYPRSTHQFVFQKK